MTLAVRPNPAPVKGHPKPRIAPPVPLLSGVAGLRSAARALGITLMPWQAMAGRYLEAQAPDKRHLYREVAIVVARQNGKTTLLVPLIVKRLKAGRRIMHTAQNRELPREVFAQVADAISADPSLLRMRNGRSVRPRFANGQEEIRLANGGRYRIVAPTRGGARGGANDDVIIDELREMDGFDFIGAAKPTLTASPDPQIIYLSNAGEVDSVVLNSVRDRAATDPRLAYLEWSTPPGMDAGDRIGWPYANPAIGHAPTMLEYLEDEYLSNRLAGTLAIFETEHLCRWVGSLRKPLVADAAWASSHDPELGPPARPFIGIAMDPSGLRASAAAAWRQGDGTIGLRLLFDVTGNPAAGKPIDLDRLGPEMREAFRQAGAQVVGFDPLTDAALAKHFGRTEPIAGTKHANASARFVTSIESGTVHWRDAATVGTDLTWTSRKPHDESGSFQAVRANDDRPITAALAAIRAVWLASAPRPAPVKRPTKAWGF